MKMRLVLLALLAVLAAQPAFAQSQNSAPRKNFPNPNVKADPPPATGGTVFRHRHHHGNKSGKAAKHSKS